MYLIKRCVTGNVKSNKLSKISAIKFVKTTTIFKNFKFQ